MALKFPEVLTILWPLFSTPTLVPELTMVTFGGGEDPVANPVDRTFWVFCIMNDLVPALPKVSTFFNITEELQALSIMSLVVEIPSKSVVVLIFGMEVAAAGFTVDRLKDIALRLIMFLETIALCKMFPVGNDFEVTLTYWGVPMMVALEVREPKPMMVLAVPWDITVLNVPVFVLMGILENMFGLVTFSSNFK